VTGAKIKESIKKSGSWVTTWVEKPQNSSVLQTEDISCTPGFLMLSTTRRMVAGSLAKERAARRSVKRKAGKELMVQGVTGQGSNAFGKPSGAKKRLGAVARL
jgi:hypothetical protein